MKTSVNMIRTIGGFEIIQRTKDGMFEANSLLLQWNKSNSRRRIDKFLEKEETKKFIEVLEQRTNPKVENDQSDYKVVKEIKGRNTSTGRTPNKVWMHPLLFIDFAMYINPSFKYDVLRFVQDQLIELRNEAGDCCKELNKQISNLKKFNKGSYSKAAEAINYIVFNEHYKDIRQTASVNQAKEVRDIEQKLIFAIENEFITTINQLIDQLRKMYRDKYIPKCLR